MGKTKQNRITAKNIHKREKRRCKMILLREKYRKDGKGKMQISQGGVTRPPSQFESYSLSASSKSYSDGFVFWGSLNTTIRTLLNYIYIHMFLAWFGPCLWPYLACNFCVIWPMCCCLIWSMILAWFYDLPQSSDFEYRHTVKAKSCEYFIWNHIKPEVRRIHLGLPVWNVESCDKYFSVKAPTSLTIQESF